MEMRLPVHVMKRPLLRRAACSSFQAAAMHVEEGQAVMVVDAEIDEEEEAAAAAATTVAVNTLCLMLLRSFDTADGKQHFD